MPNAGTIIRPISLRKTLESNLSNKLNLPDIKPIRTKPKRGSVEKNKLKNINFLSHWNIIYHIE